MFQFALILSTNYHSKKFLIYIFNPHLSFCHTLSLSIILYIGKYLENINHSPQQVLYLISQSRAGLCRGQFPDPKITSLCTVVRMLRIWQDIINKTPALVIRGLAWVLISMEQTLNKREE